MPSPPSAADDLKAQLRALRDRLALEAPRARARQDTPPELVQRLQAVADDVGRAYLLLVQSKGAPATYVEEACEDALAEGHLALHEWERSAVERKERTSTPRPDKRQHQRYQLNTMVRLLRHRVREDGSGGVTLDHETVSRPARNISLGGIYVQAKRADVPDVSTGSVVHIAVSTSSSTAAISFEARAVVVHRDETGIGLRWVLDSAHVKQSIESLLSALKGWHSQA